MIEGIYSRRLTELAERDATAAREREHRQSVEAQATAALEEAFAALDEQAPELHPNREDHA